MKVLRATYILLLFISPLHLFQQSNYTLQLKTDDQTTVHGFSYWSEVKVKSKDTSFYTSLHLANPDVIALTKKGTYTVTCTSVFGHSFSKTVEVKKAKTKLKFKGMKNYYSKAPDLINLSERLKNNDTLIIVYSTGNPAINYEKLGIVKRDNLYFALQYQGLTTDIFQTMQINEQQLAIVVKFEVLSRDLKTTPGCITPEVYTIQLNKELHTFTDLSCGWNGFNGLKAVLFMVEGN